MLKDKLILLAINPKTGYMRAQNAMNLLFLGAVLYDLIMLEKLAITSGKISINPGSTGDPVLDSMTEKLSASQGKKLSIVINKLSFSARKFYKSQINYLEANHLIKSRPLVWLGIQWGRIYCVNRAEKLKADFNMLERVLIYGRKTNTYNRLLIELLGYGNLLDSFFMSREYKQISKNRLKSLGTNDYEQFHESLNSIRKQLISQLRASKAMKG